MFVHSGVCLKGALCVQETVAYEHMHVSMLMYMWGCLLCRGKGQVCTSSERAEKGAWEATEPARVTRVPTLQLHQQEDLSETRHNFSKDVKPVPSPVFSVERYRMVLEV